MLATVIKHYLYDTGLNIFFDQISCNFSKTPSKYLGHYWTVLDKDDGTIMAWGLCIEETTDYIVLKCDFGEYTMTLSNYWDITPSTEKQMNLLDGDAMSDEELIQALNDDNRLYN